MNDDERYILLQPGNSAIECVAGSFRSDSTIEMVAMSNAAVKSIDSVGLYSNDLDAGAIISPGDGVLYASANIELSNGKVISATELYDANQELIFSNLVNASTSTQCAAIRNGRLYRFHTTVISTVEFRLQAGTIAQSNSSELTPASTSSRLNVSTINSGNGQRDATLTLTLSGSLRAIHIQVCLDGLQFADYVPGDKAVVTTSFDNDLLDIVMLFPQPTAVSGALDLGKLVVSGTGQLHAAVVDRVESNYVLNRTPLFARSDRRRRELTTDSSNLLQALRVLDSFGTSDAVLAQLQGQEPTAEELSISLKQIAGATVGLASYRVEGVQDMASRCQIVFEVVTLGVNQDVDFTVYAVVGGLGEDEQNLLGITAANLDQAGGFARIALPRVSARVFRQTFVVPEPAASASASINATVAFITSTGEVFSGTTGSPQSTSFISGTYGYLPLTTLTSSGTTAACRASKAPNVTVAAVATEVSLSWSAVADAASYIVRWRFDCTAARIRQDYVTLGCDEFGVAPGQQQLVTTTNHTVTELQPSVNYTFEVAVISTFDDGSQAVTIASEPITQMTSEAGQFC